MGQAEEKNDDHEKVAEGEEAEGEEEKEDEVGDGDEKAKEGQKK